MDDEDDLKTRMKDRFLKVIDLCTSYHIQGSYTLEHIKFQTINDCKVFLKKTSETTMCSWLHCFLIEHIENTEKNGAYYFSGQYYCAEF
jgi:hypothetical protein